MGYRFLIINSGVPNVNVGTIIESRDAIFFENEFVGAGPTGYPAREGEDLV